LKLISDFLDNSITFLQQERRLRIIIVLLLSLVPVCLLFTMSRSLTRQRSTSADPAAIAASASATPTQTKWWIRHEKSETPVYLLPRHRDPITDTPTINSLATCPSYASDFKPGTFGYVSLYPPYENMVRSGVGKDSSTVGFIEVGGWLKILAEPVCTADGYVWVNVESSAGSSGWTAGGDKATQWVIPCPVRNKMCSESEPTRLISRTPHPNHHDQLNGNDANNCVSDKLAVGLNAQVNPNDLLVVRSEPLSGTIFGYIAPLTVIHIIDGPKCVGGIVWWEILGTQKGWAVENSLRACPKEGECEPWQDKPLPQ
jgi:hypothetical protein